jgi:hypothetical protein
VFQAYPEVLSALGRLDGTFKEPSLSNALYAPRSGNVLALAGFKGKIRSRAGVVKQE